MARTYPTIAVVNGSDEIMESIAEVLGAEGYNVSKLHASDIRAGTIDFISWLQKHDPKILIYDIHPPYEKSLNFLKMIQDLGAIQNRCLILTTTNLQALHTVNHGIKAYEVLGKPFDLDELITIVKDRCSIRRKAS